MACQEVYQGLAKKNEVVQQCVGQPLFSMKLYNKTNFRLAKPEKAQFTKA